MRLQRESNGEPVILSATNLLGAGGEARIFAVLSHPTLAAKIYHRTSSAQTRKLSAMLGNPPDGSATDPHHISIAWPVDRLATPDTPSRFVGYLMPRVSDTLPVFQYYNPASRRKHSPLFSYKYLIRTARNLASAIRALHSRGYVVGDMNESNILVTSTALVTLVDTDSFQVPDMEADVVYRCTVGKPEYTPPELHGVAFDECNRTAEHDLFGLAIVLFQLLMEGTHPFAGEYTTPGEPEPYYERIARGQYPYGTRYTAYLPSPAAPPINVLHPTLRSLMLQCFEDGYRDPAARPDAQTWLTALREAEQQLQVCGRNSQHYFAPHLSTCPWCERKTLLAGRDPFPSHHDVESRVYLSKSVPLPRMGVQSNSTAQLPPPTAQPAFALVPSTTSVGAVTSLQLPDSPLIWIALICTIASIGAYQFDQPIASIICGSIACIFVIGCASIASSRRGIWIAWLSLALSGVTSADSALDLQAAKHPAAVRVISLAGGARHVAFSPDGKIIATGTNRAEDQRLIGGEVQEWNPDSGGLMRTLINYPGSVSTLSFTPDSRYLVVASSAPMEPGSVDILDTRFQGVRKSLESVSGAQLTEAVSPDGHTVAIGSLSGTVDLVDPDATHLRRLTSVKGEVLSLAFSPDGRSMAIATGSPPGSIVSGSLSVVSLATGATLWTQRAHGNAVLTIAYTRDGKELASGGNDTFLRFWDANTGVLLQQHELQTGQITTLDFSHDGRFLATAAESNARTGTSYPVLVFDVNSWVQIRELRGHEARVSSLSFSPDGSLLASGGLDSTLRVWRLNTSDAAQTRR